MIKDVLVHLDSTAAGRERMDYAFNIAATHGARLTGAHVLAPVDVPPYYRPSAVERASENMERHAREDATASEALFRTRAAKASIPTLWRSLEGGLAHRICELARSADIVILGQYEAEGSPERHPLYLADDVVVGCGRPVVVTPDEIGDAADLKRALLGWDGSREAVRAIHDVLPLLVVAHSQVDIVVVDQHEPELDPTDLLDHLARHGIAVDASQHIHSHRSAGSTLVEQLNARKFDLLVMGAYGRPAWLEFLFGGATKSALTHATTPVLVSH